MAKEEVVVSDIVCERLAMPIHGDDEDHDGDGKDRKNDVRTVVEAGIVSVNKTLVGSSQN